MKKIVDASFGASGIGNENITGHNGAAQQPCRSAVGRQDSLRSAGIKLATGKLAPAGDDSDGRTDLAVCRRANRVWYILKISNGAARYVNFGLGTDFPLPLNYVR